MIPLDSPRWAELCQCYGPASNVPALLTRLAEFPPEEIPLVDPWEGLWMSLYHQGSVYPASFAAVPHIIRLGLGAPDRVTHGFFCLPASIECARVVGKIAVPDDLRPAYEEAWRTMPSLVAACVHREWDDAFGRSALSALALAKGFSDVGQALLDLDPDVFPDFHDWILNR